MASVGLRLSEAFLKKIGPEPDWLRDVREAMLEESERLTLPPLDKVRVETWRLDAADPAALPARPGDLEPPKSGFAVFHGEVLRRAVPESLLAAGVRVRSFQEMLREDPDFLQAYLFRHYDRLTPNRLLALHRAFLESGIVVHVPPNVVGAEPLELTTFVHGDAFPHTLIVLESNAQLDVVETLTSLEETQGTVNAFVELHLAEGARLRYFGIQTVSPKGVRLYRPKHGFVGRDARLEWYLLEVGGLRTVAHNTSHLIGAGASSDSATVFLGTGRQEIHVATTMLHETHHTESNMETRGVLKDRAHAAYIGTTDIFRDSPGCQSWQKESTLLLSDDCRVDLIPALWIRNHDVSRAGHAAAAGRVNEEQLYYLMSRGIPKTEAELLIVFGYLKPLIDKIPLPPVVDRLTALVEKKVRA